jgi:hypothetical protein
MRKLGRVIPAFAIAALLAAIGVASSGAAARAAGFDGHWSVEIQTVQGKCGTYRAGVEIAGGQVLGSPGDYAISGTVSSSGVAAVTVINEQGSATGTGRLHGPTGTGRWRSSSGECSGTWTATLRP